MSEFANTPNVPEEGTYNYHIYVLESVRSDFMRSVIGLRAKPTPDRFQVMQDHRDRITETYGSFVTSLINDDSIPDIAEKATIIQTVQKGESIHRVKAFNGIAGHEILQPREYPSIEKRVNEILDETLLSTREEIQESIAGEGEEQVGQVRISFEDWGEMELELFEDEIDQDLNALIKDINENHPYVLRQRFINSGLERIKEVSTIAGGVALGVLIAKKLGKDL